MRASTLRTCFLSTLLAAAATAAERAEPIPAPTQALQDYDGKGVIQVEIPPSRTAPSASGDRVVDPGFTAWFTFRQAYVRPDRLLLELYIGSQTRPAQKTLIQGNAERTYSPGSGYAVERVFKNLETATE